MADIFDEINEELRKDKLDLFFHKHGKKLALAIGLLILSVAIYAGQQSYSKSIKQNALSQYFTILKNIEKDPNKSFEDLKDLADSAPQPVKALSALKAATYLIETGKPLEAAPIYAKLANDSHADKAFRNLAAISLTKLVLLKPDLAQKPDAEKRLKEIAKSSHEPFNYSVNETLGYLDLQNGKKDDAVKDFSAVANDPQAPMWMKKRTEELLKSF